MIHNFLIPLTHTTSIHQNAPLKYKIIQCKDLPMNCCQHKKSHPLRDLSFPNTLIHMIICLLHIQLTQHPWNPCLQSTINTLKNVRTMVKPTISLNSSRLYWSNLVFFFWIFLLKMAADNLKLLISLAGCIEPLILFVGLGKPFSFIAVDLIPNDECGSIWL